MSRYSDLEHWEETYKRDSEPFDWFNKYPSFKPFLVNAGLAEDSSILVLGCGTSQLSESLWADGYQQITNVDFSPTCISVMEKRCADKQGMTFHVMNMLDLSELEGQTFSFIIDKGTLDCVLCGEDSFENALKALREVHKVLAPGGVYIVISYGIPEFRLNHLQKDEFKWTVELQTVEKPIIPGESNVASVDQGGKFHYIYICKKVAKQEEEDLTQAKSEPPMP